MATLRNSKDIIKGGHLMILIDKEVNGEPKLVPIAFATSHTFSKQLNTQDIACKDFGDVAAVLPQNYSWTAQTDNLYSINGYQELNNKFKNMEKITIYFGETNYRQTSTQDSIVDVEDAQDWKQEGFGEQGKAYITALDVTASAGENATFSATFTGTGTLEEINEEIEYDISLIIGSSTLIDQITLSPTSANAGDTITVTPNGAEYYAPNVVISTSPSTTVTWNDYTTDWTFTMPASDTTVTASLATKYSITKIVGYADSYDVEPNTQMLPGSYVYLVPIQDSTYIPANNYAMSVETVNSGDPISVSWVDVSSYWQFEMPAQNVNTYIYQTI